MGLGVIPRSLDGGVLVVASRQVTHCTLEIAEAKAIIMAVHFNKRNGFQEVIMESDFQCML